MVPVSFVGALGHSTVTLGSPDIWYLQKSVRPPSRPPLRVVYLLDAAPSRTEMCTRVINFMNYVESVSQDQHSHEAEPTSSLPRLRLGRTQVVLFLRALQSGDEVTDKVDYHCKKMMMTILKMTTFSSPTSFDAFDARYLLPQ